MLEEVCRGPSDPMFWVKQKADADNAKEKVDLGVGIYRNELGKYQEFGVIKSVRYCSKGETCANGI
jgi:aspartate aminotransferase, cytoplasmic